MKKNVRTEVWDDFDLEVSNTLKGASRDFVWSISDTSIVEFRFGEDGYGREVDFQAKNIGKTTITCKNENCIFFFHFFEHIYYIPTHFI